MSETKPYTILSIDDDKSVSKALSLALEEAGYHVVTENNPKHAIKLPEKIPAPDLILMDIQMPEMDGYQVSQSYQTNQEWALSPLVFLTADSTQENRLKAFQMGAVGFVSKPLKRASLFKLVDRYLKLGQEWKESHSKETHENRNLPAPYKKTGKPGDIKNLNEFIKFLNEYHKIILPLGTTAENLYDKALEVGISENNLMTYIAQATGLSALPQINEQQIYLGILPLPFCQKHQVIPIHYPNQELAFAISNPFLLELHDLLQSFHNAPWVLTAPKILYSTFKKAKNPPSKQLPPINKPNESESLEEINQVIDDFEDAYFDDPQHEIEVEETILDADLNSEAPPVIKLVNKLIENAYYMDASDIHIEPWQDGVAVRYRVDGKLQLIGKLTPLSVIYPIAARLKIMSDLNIAEKRLPQDGRIQFKKYSAKRVDIDLRLATSPMNHGEKIVMRILDKQKSTLPLEELGFRDVQLRLYREQIRSPYGMVLHVGPTGSGKSMTLYAAINEINHMDINIQTAEDPIEYTLYGINQLQVKPEIGLTFARALRSYLRQDPDVILVGEIRDKETAMISIEAALTGHMLFSTLHTNDAPSTLIRFIEMGIEPFMISSSIVMICAQRLVRRLCKVCKAPYQAQTNEKEWLNWPLGQPLELHKAVGCDACHGVGYKGRVGIYELLVPNDEVRNALNQPGMTAESLKRIAIKNGMNTLFQEGMQKVKDGLTSTEEIIAHIRKDNAESKPHDALVKVPSETDRLIKAMKDTEAE